jgi:hypothetical protein
MLSLCSKTGIFTICSLRCCAVLCCATAQGIQGLNTQLDVAQTYVDGRKAKMAGGAQGQHANHSVNVVGQLKAELMNTTKEFKVMMHTH